MALKGESLYLMPNDGRDGALEIFVFDLDADRSAVVACRSAETNRCLTGGRPVALR